MKKIVYQSDSSRRLLGSDEEKKLEETANRIRSMIRNNDFLGASKLLWEEQLLPHPTYELNYLSYSRLNIGLLKRGSDEKTKG